MSNVKTPKAGRPYVLGYGIPDNEEGILPWSHVCERMEKAINYWVGTTDPQSRPHATPVWGVWVDETVYFDGSPATRRGRNIAANPAVAIHLESGNDVVILQGEAYEITASLEFRERLSEAYTAKYKDLGYTPGPETWADGGLYEVQAWVVFAWREFPKDATRWEMAAD